MCRAVELDPAHWVATAAPIDTINCDPVLLGMLNTDHSGRLTCEQISAAIKWLLDTLADTTGVDQHSTTLSLAALNTDTPEDRFVLCPVRSGGVG